MARLTQKCNSDPQGEQPEYTVAPKDLPQAIAKLAKFENLYQALLDNQEQNAASLSKLQVEGKEKTVQFKELLMQKHSLATMVRFFKAHGI